MTRPSHYYNSLTWGPLKPTSILGYRQLMFKCTERYKHETGDNSRSHCAVALIEHYVNGLYPLTPDLPDRLRDWGRPYPVTFYLPRPLLRKAATLFKYQTGQDSRTLLVLTLQEAYMLGHFNFAKVEKD